VSAIDFSTAEALTVLCSADVVRRRMSRLMEKGLSDARGSDDAGRRPQVAEMVFVQRVVPLG
jgi:hypothetical protein